MIPHLFFYHLAILGFLWVCIMLHYIWPSQCAVAPLKPAERVKPRMVKKLVSITGSATLLP